MGKIISAFQAAYRLLEPKWQYIAETLAELLVLAALVLAGVLGFVPWLLWRGLCRLIRRIRKGEGHGPAENIHP